jgi:hypothetical protein
MKIEKLFKIENIDRKVKSNWIYVSLKIV